MNKNTLFYWVGVGCAFWSLNTSALEIPENSLLHSEASSTYTKKPFRIQGYNELMTTSLQSDSKGVPNADGSVLSPMNLYGWLALDYQISPDYRLLYHQRYL